jgi:hypothetical protein
MTFLDDMTLPPMTSEQFFELPDPKGDSIYRADGTVAFRSVSGNAFTA